jgi:hypothetical protein
MRENLAYCDPEDTDNLVFLDRLSDNTFPVSSRSRSYELNPLCPLTVSSVIRAVKIARTLTHVGKLSPLTRSVVYGFDGRILYVRGNTSVAV